MDKIVCISIFLMGGFAAVTLIRLIFLFFEKPFRKPHNEHYLRQIANALRPTE
jgi:hypothetical protein